LGQTITYKDPAGPRWFEYVRDIGGQLSGVLNTRLTPSRNSLDSLGRFNQLGTGHFFPFYNARWEENFDINSFFISPAFLHSNAQLIITAPSGNLKLNQLNNVDVVFTSNKELWSRCIVIETASPYYYQTVGVPNLQNLEMFDVRKSPSVGKDGNPDNTGTTGFSWFPGYAIDVETGQRLNIFFGENSSFSGQFGNLLDQPGIASDMIFNPSSQIFAGNAGSIPMSLPLGGQHFIYVTRQKYDGCAGLRTKLADNAPTSSKYNPVSAITWTCASLTAASTPLKSIAEGLIPNDVTVKLRAQNPYNKERVITNLNKIKDCETVNKFPVYQFEFKGKQAQDLVGAEYVGALSNVNVVPNPYYAYSAYETSQFVNTVKITNLPDGAVVSIYTLDGKFIRQYKRDEIKMIKTSPDAPIGSSQTSASLEWDMKNFSGIPIASGVYLIHVVDTKTGEERTLKWFGINRKFDPTGL
jgi:hypothetical protein